MGVRTAFALAVLLLACRGDATGGGGTPTAASSTGAVGKSRSETAGAAAAAECGEDPFAVAYAIYAMPWGSQGTRAQATATAGPLADDEVVPLTAEARSQAGGGPGRLQCRVDSLPAPGLGPGVVGAALPGHRVLLVGGSTPGAVVRPTTRSYVSIGGRWTTAELSAARTSHTATALADGRVLVTGGFQSTVVQALRSSEVFDPASNQFVPTGDMRAARANHAAALLPDGRVLIVGGQDERAQLLATTELYDPAGGQFLPGPEHGAGQVLAAVPLQDGRVLVIGAQVASLFDPVRATFTAVGKPLAARTGGASAVRLTDGRVLVTGGFSGARSTALAEVFDPATGSFAPVGPMQAARRFHLVLPLPDGRAWVLGGIGEDGDSLDSTELFDARAGSFTMHTVRLARAGAELAGTVLVP
ncbi:MAG: kelch repeat-containing protein [Dehalococcoidia bacterium]